MNTTPEHQHTTLACFLRIARHFGLDLSHQSLTHEFSLRGEAELPLSEIVRMAKGKGLKAKIVSLSWSRVFQLGAAFPALAKCKDGKSVIVSGVRAEQGDVAILDPLSAQASFRFIDQQTFEQMMSGDGVLFKRSWKLTDEAQPFGLRWFLPQLLKQKKLFRDVGVAVLTLNVLTLAFPLFFQLIVDKVLVHRSLSTLHTLGLGMFGVILFEAIFSYVKQFMLLHATNKIDLNLSRSTFGHLVSLPIDFFEKSSSGVLVKHMQQTEKIRGFLTGKLFMTILEATVLVVLIPVLLLYSVQLSLLVCLFSSLIAVVILVSLRPFRAKLQSLYNAEGERQAHLVEAIHGVFTIKSLALEPAQRKDWDDRSAMAISMQFDVGKLLAFIRMLTGILEKAMLLGILWFGVFMVFEGQMTVGALIAFNMLAGRVTGPLVGIVSLINEYQEVGLSIAMLGNIMNRPPERPGQSRGLVSPIAGRIELERVTFRYGPEQPPAVLEASLSLPAGKTLGIVGRSGSGKSTLTRLIQGLYPIQEGLLTIDGTDVREFDLPHLRRNIGVVLQESFLFRGTVRQNIAVASPGASFEQIVMAARLAGADEFIQRLSQGYDTLLAEGAANLSGGQKQRLSIARALLMQPRILILDEATSALDAESEAIVQASLAGIAKGRTTVIISHRLSMIVRCDQILVMDQGKIVDAGTHHQLLERCGIYQDLWQKQHQHIG
jgi:ATP-binding cassette subfamily B protein